MTSDPQLLRGKYRVLEPLGQGGMAVVHAGVHVGTDRPVAIKRLLPSRARDPKLVARFEREAKAAGRIRSKHVLEVLDIDRDEQGAPFLVMERLFGETLSDKIRRERRLVAGEALEITRQLLAGLAEAHGAGVIHRDLKPSNIFLEVQGDGAPVVKIVDFGISKLRGADVVELTAQGETLGTVSYMPPEQLGGAGDISPATDLWAVGVMLFRMLTGKPAFTGGDTVALVMAILNDPAPRLAGACEFAPAVVGAVQPILDRALEKEPKKRFWGADEMRAAVEAAARQLGVPARSESIPGDAPAAARAESLRPNEVETLHETPTTAGLRPGDLSTPAPGTTLEIKLPPAWQPPTVVERVSAELPPTRRDRPPRPSGRVDLVPSGTTRGESEPPSAGPGPIRRPPPVVKVGLLALSFGAAVGGAYVIATGPSTVSTLSPGSSRPGERSAAATSSAPEAASPHAAPAASASSSSQARHASKPPGSATKAQPRPGSFPSASGSASGTPRPQGDDGE